jgi:hypothetical protein
MDGLKTCGREGEADIVEHVPCPNCGCPLMCLPEGYPMYDVLCTACSFRAQVKTNRCKPKGIVFGATWDILHKVLKAGYMVPPLIVNFKWQEGDCTARQQIRFYPFIPKANLKKKLVRRDGKEPLEMFNYIGLLELPHFILHDE